jgi:vacuolar-type H+-ATPase subunit E/Vma4
LSNVTQEMWLEWRDHPVTEAVRQAVRDRIEQAKDQLTSPDSNPERDTLLKGMIWAFKEVLDAKPEIQGENSDEV